MTAMRRLRNRTRKPRTRLCLCVLGRITVYVQARNPRLLTTA